MLALRYAKKSRALFSQPYEACYFCSCVSASQPFSTNSTCSFFPSSSSRSTVASNGYRSEMSRKDLANYFRGWFMLTRKPLLERIFHILRTQDNPAADVALSGLHFQLTQELVLDVLNYGSRDVLSCLKFFDWAGLQPGFYHTKMTFSTIFRILSKEKLMSLTLEFLHNYEKQIYVNKIRYFNILVMGYAVARKPETALQILGKIRFMGMDLDPFSYHVLMNSLVEQGHFDIVEMLAKHVKTRGLQNEVTHAIMIKSFCKQDNLEKGVQYLRALVKEDNVKLGAAVGTVVDALCKDSQFERAAKLVEEFRSTDFVSMKHAYGVWLKNLVRVGELDGALDFLKDKLAIEGCVPDVFWYNMLICGLLRENRIGEVHDLLADMKERNVLPNAVTMNATLCFLCKAGLVDIAFHLYESRADFGLSLNFMAYKYLIDALLEEVNVDEVCHVLRSSIEQGYLPGDRTLSTIVDALWREGKMDKMTELVQLTVDQNIVLYKRTYNKFITYLCRASRVNEGYSMHELLNGSDKAPHKCTNVDLISGLSQSSRGDIASRLFIEMQEKGHRPTRTLVRKVISAFCNSGIPEDKFFKFFEMQLARCPSAFTYNAFIDGAGHVGKPELARQVYVQMRTSGLEPNLRTNILLLRSYIRSRQIDYAVQFFIDLSQKWRARKLWVTMVVGLCKANSPLIALRFFDDMKAIGMVPSIECYEELIKALCEVGRYGKAIHLVNDMTESGRPISSFIGNVFLLHALRTKRVYHTWALLNEKEKLNSACQMLGHTIGVFSGATEEDYDEAELETLVRESFRIDMYTNNMLLRRISMSGVDRACQYLYRLLQEGYEANKWTYDIIVHGLLKDGRTEEARTWMEEMRRRGLDLTHSTKLKCMANQ